MRFRANVDRASPANANVIVPSDCPSMSARQTKSTSASQCSDV